MCQPIVLGTDYGTRKFDLGSGAEFLCKKSLFYGPVESYFTAYDSVVLTGPIPRTAAAAWRHVSLRIQSRPALLDPASAPDCQTVREHRRDYQACLSPSVSASAD